MQSPPPGPVLPMGKAGDWYPGSAAACAAEVDRLLAEAPDPPPLPGPLIALVLPHAGWRHSGRICAAGVKAARGQGVETVVVLGVCHDGAKIGLRGAALHSEGSVETPLGYTEVDRELAAEILRWLSGAGPRPEAFAGEHSVEVIVPFLQRALGPAVRLVPMLVRAGAQEEIHAVASALEMAVNGFPRRVLLVASTDLAHGAAKGPSEESDAETVASWGTLDPRVIHWKQFEILGRKIPNLQCTMCGRDPVQATLWAARLLGGTRVTVLARGTSADSPLGTPDRVVGYAAAAVTGGGLDPEAQREMLHIAREAVVAAVSGEPVPEPDLASLPAALSEKGPGLFVTLRQGDRVRACVGVLASERPLARLVSAQAVSAATKDHRVATEPLTKADLRPVGGVKIEVSVLGPVEGVEDPAEIIAGVHGVSLDRGEAHAVLLPQVAMESRYGREQFLVSLCKKARIPEEAWKEPGTRLRKFTAFVFSE